MEKQLTDAGFVRLDSLHWEHPDRGRFYRSETNGRWYLQAKDGPAKFVGRTLREAIGKVVENAGPLFQD